MTSATTPQANFSRYFAVKQRAFLINISEDRDRNQYESLSGTIVTCAGDSLSLQVPYTTGLEGMETSSRKTSYKITSESMGHGIQIMAELIRVSASNVFHLKLHGNLEMYQRRQLPRVDITLKTFQIRRDTSLAVYRKEFKRIMDGMNIQGKRPNLKLEPYLVNLSAGGIRIAIEPQETVSPLSMFFLDLDPAQLLVCAVAELVWIRHESEKMVCGYRFMQIHKADQDRISKYVLSIQKDQGVATPLSRTYWELLDRMSSEEPAKQS